MYTIVPKKGTFREQKLLTMLLTPELIRKGRQRKGLTQQAVADAIGVTLKSYQYYESGDRNPKHDKVIKLMGLLDIGTNVGESQDRIKAFRKAVSKYEEKGYGIPPPLTPNQIRVATSLNSSFLFAISEMVSRLVSNAENRPFADVRDELEKLMRLGANSFEDVISEVP